jgi:hypothetical protein
MKVKMRSFSQSRNVFGINFGPYKGYNLKGQSHEKVGEMSVWGISLGPN